MFCQEGSGACQHPNIAICTLPKYLSIGGWQEVTGVRVLQSLNRNNF